MTILAIGSVLLGTVLGRFFNVWVLVPASALTFAIVFASSAYYEQDLLSALLEFAVITPCLQIGYASGLLSCVIREPHEIPPPILASGGDTAPATFLSAPPQ